MRCWMELAVAIGVGLSLSACSAVGPTRVEPDAPLQGIAQLLDSTAQDGSLNILIVHGMGAYKEETHEDILAELIRRLDLSGSEPASKVDLPVAAAVPAA